jgi:hypothetical protein
VTFTKQVAKSDKITIDGTDVSNAFSVFGRPSADSLVDVSGFSVTGVDENLPGPRAQTFTGTAFYTEEFASVVEPLYKNRTPCVITWQPNGLVDATREIYSGTCTITEFSPENTRGSVSSVPFTATPDANGITVGNWT